MLQIITPIYLTKLTLKKKIIVIIKSYDFITKPLITKYI